MSEKIYAWLLRLYPSHFRETYGEESLQLVRDRCRDEKGFLPRLRLWFDLLSDFAFSAAREYFHVQPELTRVAARLRSGGGPSLLILEDQSLGPGAWFFGSVLASVAVVSFAVLLNHGVKHVPLSALIRPARSSADHRSSSFSPHPPALSRDSQEPASAPTTAVSVFAGAKLDRATRQRVVAGAAENLKQHYVDPVVAQKMADALLEHDRNGDDDAATDGRAFADLLTRQMRDVSHDRHLEVLYSDPPWPAGPPPPALEARYRKAMEQANCSFEPVKVLSHHIGYLKLNSFPDRSLCQQRAMAAMASLNSADAIIFDLRDNRGGYPSMVMLIAAYLFDHPEYLYNPREDTTEDRWTRSPVPGSQLADKPVYVLTSGRTFSAAEQFSYNLKMLKRATLVGERTGGSTDVGNFHRLDDHFGIGIRETRAINPHPEPDWAGTGVEPEVTVKAADALETAVKLAESKLLRKSELMSSSR